MSATTGLVRASRHDWERVARLAIAAVETDPALYSNTVADLRAVTEGEWREYCSARASKAVFVVLVDRHEVGMVVVSRTDDHHAAMTDLWVRPSHRNQTWGRTLIEACLEWCQFFSLDTLTLSLDPRALTAGRLYRRLGFVPGPGTNELSLALSRQS